MLVLSRRKDETIMIGDDVEITIVDVRGDTVRLGIKAPRSVSVHRKEIYDAIQAENIVAAQGTAPDKTAVGGLGDLLKAGGGGDAVTPAALGKLAGLAAGGTAAALPRVKVRASGLDKLMTKGKTVRVARDGKS